MTSRIHLTASILLLLAAAGCAPKAPVTAPSTTYKPKGAPAWTYDAASVPGLHGVGLALPNVLNDLMLQRKIALAQARNEIATQLETRAQGLHAQAMRLATNSGTDGKKPVTSQAGTAAVEDTIREVVNVKLTGATPREFWTDPESRVLYALVVLDPEAAAQAARAAAAAAIRKEVGQGERDLDAALDRLDQAIANQSSNP